MLPSRQDGTEGQVTFARRPQCQGLWPGQVSMIPGSSWCLSPELSRDLSITLSLHFPHCILKAHLGGKGASLTVILLRATMGLFLLLFMDCLVYSWTPRVKNEWINDVPLTIYRMLIFFFSLSDIYTLETAERERNHLWHWTSYVIFWSLSFHIYKKQQLKTLLHRVGLPLSSQA